MFLIKKFEYRNYYFLKNYDYLLLIINHKLDSILSNNKIQNKINLKSLYLIWSKKKNKKRITLKFT